MKNNKPVHEVKVGAIKATIWEADGKKGPFFTVSVCRLYKTAEKKWEEANSFSGREIPTVNKVLHEAQAWIEEHELTPEEDYYEK